MAPCIRGSSNQAPASRLAAEDPGIRSPWLHAKTCNSQKLGASVGPALLAEGWSEKSVELHFASWQFGEMSEELHFASKV